MPLQGGLVEKQITPGVFQSWGTTPGAAAFLWVVFGGHRVQKTDQRPFHKPCGVIGMEGAPWKCPAAHCPSHARIPGLDTLALLHHTWNFDLLASQGSGPLTVVGAEPWPVKFLRYFFNPGLNHQKCSVHEPMAYLQIHPKASGISPLASAFLGWENPQVHLEWEQLNFTSGQHWCLWVNTSP